MLKNKHRQDMKTGYLFILPSLAIILFVFLNPMIRILTYSFYDWSYLQMGEFIKFDNYKELFQIKHFYTTLLNNLKIIITVVPVVTLIALVFAQAIFLKIPGFRIYSFLFFLPVIIPDIVIAQILTSFLNSQGPLNQFFRWLHLDFLAVDWLGDSRYSLFSIIISLIWKNIGFALLLFLARLTTLDRSIYEAAEIDGASEFQQYLFITIPLLKNIVKVYVVLQIINIMAFLFNYIFVLTDGGPGFSSTVLEYFVYLNIFKLQNMGRGAAAGVILLLISVLLISYYLFSVGRTERKKAE
ncbi:MAG: sugar ABC transporter permease [Sphaerochaeta sp.]|nr:sugar ABC transporter permease [Sphaerochaeta sp.]